MNTNVQQVKDRFSKDIEALKEKVNEVQKTANAKNAIVKSKIEGKEAIVKDSFQQVQEKVLSKRQAVKESIEEFKHNRTTKHAERRAERSEEYALACIQLALESVLEAESAILKAIDSAVEADMLKTNLK